MAPTWWWNLTNLAAQHHSEQLAVRVLGVRSVAWPLSLAFERDVRSRAHTLLRPSSRHGPTRRTMSRRWSRWHRARHSGQVVAGPLVYRSNGREPPRASASSAGAAARARARSQQKLPRFQGGLCGLRRGGLPVPGPECSPVKGPCRVTGQYHFFSGSESEATAWAALVFTIFRQLWANSFFLSLLAECGCAVHHYDKLTHT